MEKCIVIILLIFLTHQIPCLAQTQQLSHADSAEIGRLLQAEKDTYPFPYAFSAEDYSDGLKKIKSFTDSGWFYWPYRMRRAYPSPTYEYLLEHKYKILFCDIRTGCDEIAWYTLCDSLMDLAITTKYGDDFYRNSYAEAILMDKNKAGLTLPYIGDGSQENTAAAIRQSLAFVDTLRNAEKDAFPFAKVLEISFAGNKIVDVELGTMSGVVGFYPTSEFTHYNKRIRAQLNKLSWKGARFNNKPVNHTVYLNFSTGVFHF